MLTMQRATVLLLDYTICLANIAFFSEHLRRLHSHPQARAAAQQATIAVASSRRVAAATTATAISAHIHIEAQRLANAHQGSILAEAVLQRLAACNSSSNNVISPGGQLRVLATQQQPSYGPLVEAGSQRQYQGRGLRPPNSRAPAVVAVTTGTAGGGGGSGVPPPPLSPLPVGADTRGPCESSGGGAGPAGSGGAWRESGSGGRSPMDLLDLLHGSTMTAAPRFLTARPPSFLTMAPATAPTTTTATNSSAAARATTTTTTAPISCASPTMALLGGMLTSSPALFGSAPQQASSSWSVNVGPPPSRIGAYVQPHPPPAAVMAGVRTRVSLSGGEKGAAVGGQPVGQAGWQQQRLAVGGGWPASSGGPQAGQAGEDGGRQWQQGLSRAAMARQGFLPAL